MHPKALLDACSELVARVLKFDHPADAVVSRYFREHRSLGPRERATLAETAYAVLRRKLRYEHLARSGSGPRERRLAILGFHGPRDFVKSALSDAEKTWLDACDRIAVHDLLEPHRHNLPEWMAQALKAQLGAGDDFWALVDTLEQPAALDLRVNLLQARRDEVQRELAQAGVPSEVTPHSPWGLRVQGKPALQKLDAFTRGALEVQDEGSQLLALLLDAHRGEMGKTLALAAHMENKGQLFAYDSDLRRLKPIHERIARAGAHNVQVVSPKGKQDVLSDLAGKMDLVLLDAPCTGTGVWRRHPDAKWRIRPGALEIRQREQSALLDDAERFVKPGGRLVYITCSMIDIPRTQGGF